MDDARRLCRGCFRNGMWLPWELEASTMGPCAFCGARYTQTWDAASAAPHVGPLVESYELDPGARAPSSRLSGRLQSDWGLFSTRGEQHAQLLVDAIMPSLGLAPGDPVRLRAVAGVDGDAMVQCWRRFSDELREVNRWFPAEKDAVLDVLAHVIPHHTTRMDPEAVLYRARMCRSDEFFTETEMGRPPASHARAGRANPPGIPYFYAASTPRTAIKECRPVHNCLLSVAEFTTLREMSILDLTTTMAPDPFAMALSFPDGATWESYATAITSHQLRRVIGDELSRPVRPVEGEASYSSTQFLCEYAKARGCDGVRYGSAVDPGNWNVVLFDEVDLRCRSVQRHEVTTLEVTTAVA